MHCTFHHTGIMRLCLRMVRSGLLLLSAGEARFIYSEIFQTTLSGAFIEKECGLTIKIRRSLLCLDPAPVFHT